MNLSSGLGTKTKRYHFRGVFTTLVALQTAWPTAISGDRALVDTGAGNNAVPYYWDAEDGWVIGGGGGTTYTAGNGIDLNGTVFELGTSLITKDTALLWDGAVKRDFKIGPDDSSSFINIVGGSGQVYLYSDFLVYLSGGTGGSLSLGNGTTNDEAQLSSPTKTEILTTNYSFTLNEEVSAPGILLTDNAAGRGIRYAADYSATLVDLSLAHVGYVKNNFGGNPVNANVVSPTIAEDGYVLAWNHTNGEYELVVQSGGGGSVTFGAANQIPYMNAGATDFSYDDGLRFIKTTGSFYLGDNAAPVTPSIYVQSSGANVNLNLYTKGTGYVWASQAVRTGPALNVYTHVGGQGIISYDSSSSVDYTFVLQGADASWNDGRTFALTAGSAYATTGNGIGGSIKFTTGQRRIAGTGKDGNIIFDPLQGWIEITNSTGAVTITAADRAAMYVKDIAAGNAAFHFKTENGQEIKLYQTNAGSAYTVTNVTTDRTYDANATTLDEIADVLGSLITDLKLTGLIA